MFMHRKMCCCLLGLSVLVLAPLTGASAQDIGSSYGGNNFPIGWQVIVKNCDVIDGDVLDDNYALAKINFYKTDGYKVLSALGKHDVYALNAEHTWVGENYVLFHAVNSLVIDNYAGAAQLKRVVTSSFSTKKTTFHCDIDKALIPIRAK